MEQDGTLWRTQNPFGRAIIQRDTVGLIDGDYSAGDGSKNTVHELLYAGDFTEEMSIIDGDCRLVGKRGQQITVRVAKYAARDTIVRINDADGLPFDLKGRAEDRTQLEVYNAFLRCKTLVLLSVKRNDRLACLRHLMHDRAADICLGIVESFARDVPGNLDFEVMGSGKQQHSSFGPGQANDGVHDLLENFVQVKRGVNCRSDFLKRSQPLLFKHLGLKFCLQSGRAPSKFVELVDDHPGSPKGVCADRIIARPHERSLEFQNCVLALLKSATQVSGLHFGSGS